ncbi:MAG: O-antigen ligase family protein [Candidatus Omnitrophica bacterium]|nr:O-antigen ligase family protein [Candidatus Omnitrophota bacterium]
MKKEALAGILDQAVLYLLYAIAFFLPISKGIIETCSILAILFYFTKKILKRQSLPDTFLSPVIYVYLIVCLYSVFLSCNPAISARTFFNKLLQNAAFFLVVADTLNTDKRLKNFLYILFCSSALLGIDGIYQYFTLKDFIRNRRSIFTERIYATFPTPNDFGCYLSCVMPFVASVMFFKAGKVLKACLTGLFILLLACLALTISRGAWLAFLASMVFLCVFIKQIRLVFLFFLIAVLAGRSFFPDFVKDRLDNLFVFFDINKLQDVGSQDRKMIWQAGWRMFLTRPLIGLGIGTFMFNFDHFISAGYIYTASYAHNCYLQMASEIGISGLVSFLLILVFVFIRGIKALCGVQKTFIWYVLAATLASLLGYCVQMAVDTNFYSLDLGLLFWLLLGLVAATVKELRIMKG